MSLVGTAGHVSHGKSALVERLTGKNPMHLPQEKDRSMTIELGFSSIPTPTLPLGVVDVPGHERYIRHMMSALWALDAVCFVVALDDGVRPMTRVHWELVMKAEIPHIFWVFTKSDLFSSQEAAVRVQEIFADMGVTPPSRFFLLSNVTGEGVEDLREALVSTLEHLPPKSGNPLELYLDQVFVLKGQGRLGRGSLAGGTLRLGEDWKLYPSGEKVTLRSLQSYHQNRESIVASSRVALGVRQKVLLAKGQLLAGERGVLSGHAWIFRIHDPSWLPPKGKSKEIEVIMGSSSSLGVISSRGDSWIYVTLNEALACLPSRKVLLVSQGGTTLLDVAFGVWAGEQKKLSEEQRGLLKQFDLSQIPLSFDSWQCAQKGGRQSLQALLNPADAKNWGVCFGSFVSLPWIARQDEQDILKIENGLGRVDPSSSAVLRIFPSQEMAQAFIAFLESQGHREQKRDSQPGGLSSALSLNPWEKKILDWAQKSEGLFSYSSLPLEYQRKTLLRDLTQRHLLEYLGEGYYATPLRYENFKRELLLGTQKGDSFDIATAKKRMDLSRKPLLALLGTLEKQGILGRSGDLRIILVQLFIGENG